MLIVLLGVASAVFWHVAQAHQEAFMLETNRATAQVVDPQLTGRFLHITDMHLDASYMPDSAVVSSCHREKPFHKHGGEWRSGYWGTEVSDCDSPIRLVNGTIDWLTRAWSREGSNLSLIHI